MSSRQSENRTTSQLSDEELRQQLIAELSELADRLRAQSPDYEPPPYSRQNLVTLIEKIQDQLPADMRVSSPQRLRSALSESVLDPDVWKGIYYMIHYMVQYNANMVKRRLRGEFETDEWGLDWEFVDAARPFFTFLYKVYWRVQTTGLENVPIEGRALLVSNHSGQLPWDGTMVTTAILIDHPAQRLVRSLYAALLARMPFAATMLVRVGQVPATMDNGTRLLEQGELVLVTPEGYKGLGKTYRDRYKLARFGRGGFIEMALNTRTPIIPVSVVGSEETYITLAKLPTLSKVTGIPYLPITLTFPWLGLLGFVPLPTKWYIDFGPPIPMDGYGPDAASNLVLVSQLSDQVRNTVQEMIYSRLAQRRSIFFG